jgi:hypothetical protein
MSVQLIYEKCGNLFAQIMHMNVNLLGFANKGDARVGSNIKAEGVRQT